MATNQMPRSRPQRILSGNLVHRRTGEVLEASDYAVDRTDKELARDYATAYVIYTAGVKRRLEVGLTEWQIIDILLEKYSLKQPFATITQAEIAELLGVDRTHISKTMRKMQQRLIVEAQKLGVWYVNPYIGWAGSTTLWNRAKSLANEPIWMKPGRHLKAVD